MNQLNEVFLPEAQRVQGVVAEKIQTNVLKPIEQVGKVVQEHKLDQILALEDARVKEAVLETINTNVRQPMQQIEELAHDYKNKIQTVNSIEKLWRSHKLDFIKNFKVTKDLKLFHNKAFYTFVYIITRLVFMIILGESIQSAYQTPENSFKGVLLWLMVFEFVKIFKNTIFLLFSKGKSFEAKVFILQIALSGGLVILYLGSYFYLQDSITPRQAIASTVPYFMLQLMRLVGIKVRVPFFMPSAIYGFAESLTFLLVVAKVTGALLFLSWDWAFVMYKIEFILYIILMVFILALAILIYVIFIKKLPAVRAYGILAVIVCLLLFLWMLAYTIMFYLLYQGVKIILETEAATSSRESLPLQKRLYKAAIYMEVFASLNIFVILADYIFLRNLILRNVERYIKIELSVDSIIENIKMTAKKFGKNYIAKKAINPEAIEMAEKIYHTVARPRHVCKAKNRKDVELKERKGSKVKHRKKKKKDSLPLRKKAPRSPKAIEAEASGAKEKGQEEGLFEEEDSDLEAPKPTLYCPDCGEKLEADDALIEKYIDEAKRDINLRVGKAKQKIGEKVESAKFYMADKLARIQRFRDVIQR